MPTDETPHPARKDEYDWAAVKPWVTTAIRRHYPDCPAEDLKDLIQEAWVKFHRASLRAPVENPQALASVIGQRVAIDAIRRKPKLLGLEELADDHPAPHPTVDIEAMWFFMLECLRKVDPLCVDIAILYVKYRNFADVAKELKMTREAVAQRWHRAKVGIRKMLEENPDLMPDFLKRGF